MRSWKRYPWSTTENTTQGSSRDEEFKRVGRSGEDFVLVFVDLDEFQRLNDAHGRRKGATALILVARTLLSNIRQKDMAAHYEDEFIALMPGATLIEARCFFETVDLDGGSGCAS